MTEPSPLPPGAPPPPPKRYTEPEATKSTAVRILVGFPIGLLTGLVTGLLPLWYFAGGWFLQIRGGATELEYPPFLWIPLVVAAAIAVALVWRTWRRGWRGVPIGFGIGVAVGGSLCLLLWFECAK